MAAPFPSPTAKWHSNTYPSLSPTRPELSAKGKNVIITGGGTGIGAETARYFAEAGASRIALLGRREQPLLATKASIEQKFPNVKVFTAPTDVTNRSAVDAAFAKFAGSEKLHVLVSNAAVAGPVEPLNDVDPDKFLESVQQNLGGALFVGQAFLRYATKDAVVINVSSSAAHLNIGPAFSAYSVSKLAVFRLWDTATGANPDLNVFHIQPGVVDTDMNRAAGGVKALGFEDHVSLPASFSVWLASPEARFLKGRFLWANWDVDELKARAEEIQGGTEFKVDLVGWPFGNPTWKFQVVTKTAGFKFID
ncbi:putative oxidoreductase [Pleomassaria siparia CBS 279.74]|uniref:Putative oxidoreductase n=1 Tax=Pleomassaria siparia CBS 279.74 TaxID=1314801 RepID=A0A6G1JWN2_9PLEO|nr:putative oxidoreductase [Pleomassaria siparia CBS 279.74]